MSAMVLKERGKTHLRANISWAAAVVGEEDLAASGLVFQGAGAFSTGLRVVEPLGWEGDSGWVVFQSAKGNFLL